MNTEKEPNVVEKEETKHPPMDDKLSSTLKEAIPPKKARPVIFYIGVMFGVALFLIILSFFMQQRNHEALMKGLSTSAVNVQNIVDLELEKNNLEKSIASLQGNLETTMAEKANLQAELDTAKNSLRAMEYLSEARIDHLSGRTKEAKSSLACLQKDDLYKFLPETSAWEGQPSPKQCYDELVDALN